MQSGFRHENNVTAVSHTIENNMEGLSLYRYLKTPLSGFLRRYSMNEKCGSKQTNFGTPGFVTKSSRY